MKNLSRVSLFVFAVLFLVSCGGDEPKPSLNLVGKWTIESTTADLEVNDKPLKDYLISTGQTAAQAQAAVDDIMEQIGPIDQLEANFEFKSDGSLTIVSTDDDGDTDTETGTWKLSDDKKTLTVSDSDGSSPEVLTISDYTDSTVTLKELVDSDNSSGFKLDFFLLIKLKKA